MPDGIILDPRQNPRERDFGIIYVNEMGGHFKYYKKKGEHNNRLWFAGDLVTFEISSPNQVEYYSTPRIFNGIPVLGELPFSTRLTLHPESATRTPIANYMRETMPNGNHGWDESTIDTLVPDSDVR